MGWNNIFETREFNYGGREKERGGGVATLTTYFIVVASLMMWNNMLRTTEFMYEERERWNVIYGEYMVEEHFISAIEETNNKNPLEPLLIYYDSDEVRRQVAASTQRFKEGTLVYIFVRLYVDMYAVVPLYFKSMSYLLSAFDFTKLHFLAVVSLK
nr:uncharacterized protein LOC117281206 [Nicotiana tomentosiformis]